MYPTGFAMSNDGSILVIGSPNAKEVNVLKRADPSTGWISFGWPITINESTFNIGSTLALSGDGKVLAIVAQHINDPYTPGRVYIFKAPKYDIYARWLNVITIPDITAPSAYGRSVALNYDGTVLAAGKYRYMKYD